MTSAELDELLKKYFRGDCTPEEKKFIHTWYDSIGSEHEYHLDDENHNTLESKLWSGVESFLQQEKKNSLPDTPPAKNNWLLKIAASITLLMGIGACFFLLPVKRSTHPERNGLGAKGDAGAIELINDRHVPVQYTLEDGSKVTLQPASKLHFKKFSIHKREVFLTGEGFFEVVKNPQRPFFVYAKDVVTKVLGTSFTIKAYQKTKEVNVLVRSGRVSVSSKPKKDLVRNTTKGNQEVILTPNQEAVYSMDDESLLKKLVDKPQLILARPTLFEMQYDNVSVIKIFKALEDNYGVDIVFDSEKFSTCILTTSLADEGLYERIEIICKAIGARYKIVDASIVIQGDGCQ